ncbi:hypothetical protein PF003_g22351 [Phytophthora fragariae]|nr:hypothetical protein PF003_g22351 [Phytophthora fragariae]
MGQSTSPAPGVDDTTQEISTNEDQAGPSLVENATNANGGSLSRSDAERLIRTLVGIQGGRSLAEALFEGLRDLHSAPSPANFTESPPVSNQPPPQTSRSDDREDWQPSPRQGDGLQDLQLLMTPRRQGDDLRDLPPLDNMNRRPLRRQGVD